MSDLAIKVVPVDSTISRDLNPFEYFPTRRSKIGGLGGDDSFSDPSYAFHTTYQPCDGGPITFAIKVHHLAATFGTLALRVNVIPIDLRFDAKLAKTANVSLQALADNAGEVSIEVAAKPNMLYALLGQVYEDTDATASAVSVTLRQESGGGATAFDLRADEQTRYGLAEPPGSPHLMSGKRASLLWPVSQVATAAQLQEPAFRQWSERLGERDPRADGCWDRVYVLQTLSKFDMLQDGARGLGLGAGSAALPQVMTQAGCLIEIETLASETAPIRDGVGHDEIHRKETAQAESSPERGFDFLWSCRGTDSMGSAAGAIAFIEDSIRRLYIGGLAVHTFWLGLFSGTDPAPTDFSRVVIPRQLVERLAVNLISHGHEVSQIRYDPEGLARLRWRRDRFSLVKRIGELDLVPFGFIIRRGSD